MRITKNTLLTLAVLIASCPSFADEKSTVSDILFLKIQELENEIAQLRNQIESQNHLIEKLINETFNEEDNKTPESNAINANSSIRFKGVSDIQSEEDVYAAATKSLEDQNYEDAFKLFKFFVESFANDQKSPLAFFWLGEISLINNNLEISKKYFIGRIFRQYFYDLASDAARSTCEKNIHHSAFIGVCDEYLSKIIICNQLYYLLHPKGIKFIKHIVQQ